MRKTRTHRSRMTMLVATTLLGGTLFSGCETRIKEDVLGGVRSFITGVVLNPTTITCDLFADNAPAGLCPGG